jgi:hypothetical protein
LGRFINGSKPGLIKANVILGQFDYNKQAFPIRTKNKPKKCKDPIAVKKGEEFILTYGAGYWNRMRTMKRTFEEDRSHKVKNKK